MILMKMVHYTKRKWLSGEMDCSNVFSIKKWSRNIISFISIGSICIALNNFFPCKNFKAHFLTMTVFSTRTLKSFISGSIRYFGLISFLNVSLNLIYTMCQYLENDLCRLCVPLFRSYHTDSGLWKVKRGRKSRAAQNELM